MIDLNTENWRHLSGLIKYWSNHNDWSNHDELHAGQKVWDILSALRGPDNDKMDVKLATTSVIRYQLLKLSGALPEKGILSLPGGPICNEDTPAFVSLRIALSKEYMNDADKHPAFYHFISHAKRAFHSLGLKWDEVN